MKFSVLLLGGLVLLGATGECVAEEKPSAPPVGDVADHDEASLMSTWGRIVARDQDLIGVELNGPELEHFLHGVQSAIEGIKPAADMYQLSHDAERLAAERRAALIRERERKNVTDAARVFSTFETKANMSHLANDAWLEIIAAGNGPRPKAGETLTLTYRGHLLDDTEFTAMKAFDLILVANRVAPGLFEALQQIEVGSKARIYLPPSLAKKDRSAINVPPGCATVYEVELLSVKATPPDDLANSLLPPAPEPPEPAPSGKPLEEIIAAWGWSVGHKTGIEALRLNRDAAQAFMDGLRDGIKNVPPPANMQVNESVVESYVSTRRKEAKAKERAQRLAQTTAYLDTLKTNPRVVELPNGLRYEVLQSGAGAYPRMGDMVVVDYAAHMIDGTVFDRTDNEPLHIEVGSVIPGFNEGIQHINKGGRIRLFIPPALGYGEGNTSGVLSAIPGNSLLIYDIELLDTVPANETTR